MARRDKISVSSIAGERGNAKNFAGNCGLILRGAFVRPFIRARR